MDLSELLRRGVAEVIVESELRARLQSGTPLRLKQGFDPTKPDMHIGHAVGLRKLRAFQELGHQVVLIVGDWTAQIGDPSGRDETRTRLSAAEVRANAETYMEQFFRVVDRQRTEVRWQSEWFGQFTLEHALDLAGRFTLAQMLAHETFRKRYETGAPLTILELMYPMLQAYDSVAIKADVEFGGTDQKFNILAGRELMAQLGMTPQQVFLVPLIPGTDGRKMSKTFNNTVDIRMPPSEMYGRIMSMSDEVLPLYFEVLTDVPLAEIDEMKLAMAAGQVNPRDLKMRLAREIVAQFHDPAAAAAAEAAFVRQFVEREIPEDIPTFTLTAPSGIVEVLVASGLAPSKSEARRLIDGGGVRVDGERVEDYALTLSPGANVVVQVGRRKFVRVV
ncbi:MAG TPA: tyrosine--tRNA ligase [Chloroflexus aurantiacus]|jgi:tyrosyl-tRNA synthetase|uniref:Tyrosine--tRNA ligase n=2 Tax=Chloroflexus aurantiacus TaxID=1108 RepID=A9WGW1_CHLAA|nr:tyrosine--tRNA ligase [Chloroflexus aurantiacus]ABY36277.1 tyrosyl-tRNA synthetase [Chloroflexus aurantiacus J-10-fl]RMG47043.1 MAG: tyrosine--tRNA ligase [Chloroflexota bacterium]GIV94831.1 MAG: tyrosine--tRNA ligase [Chloroflexus sp.]HBW67564.1 tyrosine--tRNA ligase [Chloroflexus aurantiacus]